MNGGVESSWRAKEKFMRKPLRVLHCPFNNGNQPWVLSRAERKLGLKSDLIVFTEHPYYPYFDQKINLDGFNLPHWIGRIHFFRWALKNYDVFHFNFGCSILDEILPGLSYLDLPILKKAGKKIIFTFQGDDARQKDFFIKKYNFENYTNKKYTLKDKFDDNLKRSRIKKVSQYADTIFALNPDLMYILPPKTKFLPYASVNVKQIKPTVLSRSKKIIIVHAPSDRLIKGTQCVIETVRMISKKYPIELILVENLSNQKSFQIYKKADIAIDQLLVGWYGSFAVELMAMAKPVVSFLRQEDIKKFVPFWNKIPIINVNQETLGKQLEQLILNYNLRVKISKMSRKFVENYHDPLKIAKEVIKYYQ